MFFDDCLSVEVKEKIKECAHFPDLNNMVDDKANQTVGEEGWGGEYLEFSLRC